MSRVRMCDTGTPFECVTVGVSVVLLFVTPCDYDVRDEREAVQKKTFTKWVNSHLARVGCHIGDLYVDLRDGFVLTRTPGSALWGAAGEGA
ncbi:hypothetical protein H8959_005295 [Pygathrix nigripes]